MIKKRQGMLKEGVAVWTRVPGTPFTLPGSPTIRERLPGMMDWAPRDTITRMARGLQKGEKSPEELAETEAQQGAGTNVGLGAVGGLTGGSLLGRLFSGQKGVEPFKKIYEKGLSGKTLRGLKHLPGAMKVLPLLGLLGGSAIGAQHWAQGRDERKGQALDVSKGLLAERILQSSAVQGALKSNNPYSAPLLQGVPISSAQTSMPYVLRAGQVGG